MLPLSERSAIRLRPLKKQYAKRQTKNAAIKFAAINGFAAESVWINSPRKTPSSIHTLIILNTTHSAKKRKPVYCNAQLFRRSYQSDFHFVSPAINSPLLFLDKRTTAQMHAYPTIAIIDASAPNPAPVNKALSNGIIIEKMGFP